MVGIHVGQALQDKGGSEKKSNPSQKKKRVLGFQTPQLRRRKAISLGNCVVILLATSPYPPPTPTPLHHPPTPKDPPFSLFICVFRCNTEPTLHPILSLTEKRKKKKKKKDLNFFHQFLPSFDLAVHYIAAILVFSYRFWVGKERKKKGELSSCLCILSVCCDDGWGLK